MAAQDMESVAPDRIAEGDVIEDQLGKRLLTVREITVGSTDDDHRIFSFYGDGPEDRMTFEEDEQVHRRTH